MRNIFGINDFQKKRKEKQQKAKQTRENLH